MTGFVFGGARSEALMMRTMPTKIAPASALAVLLLATPRAACAQASDAPTGTSSVSGTWVARNYRNPMGQLVTVVLDLTAHVDSVSGLLRMESTTGSADASVPVWGVVRADSLLLTDSQPVPLVAVRVTERRLIGRIAGTQGHRARGVPDFRKLADSRPVTFERQ